MTQPWKALFTIARQAMSQPWRQSPASGDGHAWICPSRSVWIVGSSGIRALVPSGCTDGISSASWRVCRWWPTVAIRLSPQPGRATLMPLHDRLQALYESAYGDGTK